MSMSTFRKHVGNGRRLAVSVIASSLFAASAVAGDEVDEEFVCLGASKEKCDQMNENIGLFSKAREAFDRGREIGDMTEARGYAMQLVDRGDRHGGKLMKYIYWEVSNGAHKNLVEAHGWVSGDIAAGRTKYHTMPLAVILRRLESHMTPEQLQEASRLEQAKN